MIDYLATQHLIEAMVTEKIVPGVNYAFIKGKQVFYFNCRIFKYLSRKSPTQSLCAIRLGKFNQGLSN